MKSRKQKVWLEIPPSIFNFQSSTVHLKAVVLGPKGFLNYKRIIYRDVDSKCYKETVSSNRLTPRQ